MTRTVSFSLAMDSDGNALGGIRLPHMRTVLQDGEVIGAPLGIYTGRDPEFEDRSLGYGYAVLGGTFEPFSPEEIQQRYPSQEIYVELVRKAAAALLRDGIVLEQDYQTYVREAEHRVLVPVEIDLTGLAASPRTE